MGSFTNQLKHVIRRLARSPMFTVVTLLTIALAVGANSAIFSVINGILLKPLPYPDPGALVSVWQSAPGPRHQRHEFVSIGLLHVSR